MVTPWCSFLGMNTNTEIKTGARSWSAGKDEPVQGTLISPGCMGRRPVTVVCGR